MVWITLALTLPNPPQKETKNYSWKHEKGTTKYKKKTNFKGYIRWHHCNVNDYISVRIQINLTSTTPFQGWVLYIQRFDCGISYVFF